MAERRRPRRRPATPGAIAAQLLYRHPYFELAHVTARSGGRARGSTTSTRARACRWSSRTATPTRQGDVDAALVCYPHGAAAPAVAELRERGVRVVDLSADFRLRDRGDLRGLVRRARRARAVRQARLRAARAAPRARSRAPTSSPTPAATRPPRCSRSRRWPARALIGDVVIDAKSGVSGAGREPTHDHALHLAPTRTSRPTRSSGHRHTPEIEQELARAGRDAADHVHAAPRAARPGRARLLLRDAGARARARTSWPSSTTTPTRASRGSSCALGPPGVLEVRDTNYCRISVAQRPAHGPGASSSRRSTTCGRAPRRRRCRTST